MKQVLLRSVFDAFEYVMDHYYPLGLEDLVQRKDRYAVISIQDTHTDGFGFEFTESRSCAAVLTLYFDDVVRPVEGAVCFSDRDAEELLDFIEANKSVETLLVHCYAGESRSRAVATFAVKLLGRDNAAFFRTGHPNELVFGMLDSAWQRRCVRAKDVRGAGPEMMLVEPDLSYDREIQAYRRAFLEAGSSMDGCGSLRRFERTADWLEHLEAGKDPKTVPPGLVPASQYLYVRASDRQVVGMVQIRHELNEYLASYAGHVGYSVRPDERRKGYAARMLHDALPRCRELGLDRVMVCCRLTNEGSRRTILRNGGVYHSTVWVPDREVWMERYWITPE